MSYSAPTIALLPFVLDEAHAGDYLPLAAHAGILIESLDASLAFPMHNSVVCAEDVPAFTVEDRRAGADTYLGDAVVEGLVAVCSSWPAGRRDGDLLTPLRSGRPALLLSGALDPVTPPAYAQRAIDEGLSNARHLVVPGHGHGVAAVGCMPRLLRDFLISPEPAALDADCVEGEVPMPFFVGPHGPAP
jgi:pimeloyl-ACP methyl ester carboxylesterase